MNVQVFCSLTLEVAALDGASVECECEGSYRPGDPGYFNPHDGGHPPEAAAVEDIRAWRVDTGEEITDKLTEEELAEIEIHLIEAYIEAGKDDDDDDE